ncbi:PAS domain-containing protein [Fibrella sp. HMF5335]|uniref:histidine kinase n=1 Tax=Fibrella rubiginis TaxID=2817060 RepID=A0A939K2S2_9BACT|nr:ATP-binding protein [Fibrella rubiginis]MBO0938497.1 PAS domain-containing protein [Fibrella rubiginis]
MSTPPTYAQLLAENEQLRIQLTEAAETIDAIRSGQVDALVVEGNEGYELYTLKTADQTYRVFIETMNEGAVTLGQNGLILYANSMFATMVSVPLSKVIGLSFSTFVAPESQASFSQLFEEGWIQNHKIELVLTGTSRQLACLLSVTALDLDDGRCLSVVITDLTNQLDHQRQLTANNEQLQQAINALEVTNLALNRSNENLQEFAYVASHDLQEPLRKIQQFGSLLKTTHLTELGADGVDLVTRMESAAGRMSVLIRDLLNYSRLTRPVVATQSQQLNELLAVVLAELELLIQEKNAVIEIGDLGTAPGEPTQLMQVFRNLLTNALKFVQPEVPPHVWITRQAITRADLPAAYLPINSQQHFCTIRVVDNGIGFDPRQAERIFGTFQRLHGMRQYPGTGIGLAIVKKVAENHGGYVMAESQPGEGATFTLFLPV